MDEDDDLSALRSAALASLASKPQKPAKEAQEEDLTALRQAALMTRKQKQIEVIQRPAPVEQKTVFPNWTDHGQQQVPIFRPQGDIPPPRAENWPGVGQRHQIPIFRPPEGSIPLPRHGNLRFIRPMNIPPPHLLGPPPPHIRQSRPQWRGGPPQNLINLTPGPTTDQGPRLVNFIPPLMPHLVAPQRSTHQVRNQNIVVPTPGVFSWPNKNRFPQAIRPIRHTGGKIRPTVPKSTPQTTTEPKVPDKFSRYDPDSSSDDDDDDHTVAAETSQKEEESDAESVASDKSFSSVSGASDGEDKEEEEEQQDDEPNNLLDIKEEKDEISFANEEDGILAAIDEFLEDTTETKPKAIEQTQSSTSQKVKAEGTTAKTSKKVAITAPATPSTMSASLPVQKRTKKIKQTASDGTKVTSTSKKNKISTKKDVKSATVQTSKPKVAGKVSGEVLKSKEPPQRTVKQSKVKTEEKRPTVTQNEEFSKPTRVITDIKFPEKSKRDNPTSSSTLRVVPTFVTNRESLPPPKRDLPIQQRLELPISSRQRRDSDLDSVGSSDLSFLSSSESETEEKDTREPLRNTEMKKTREPLPKKPASTDSKLKARSEKFYQKQETESPEIAPIRKIPLKTEPHDLREKIKRRKKVPQNVETTQSLEAAEKELRNVRKPSPIMIKPDRLALKTKKSTIISLKPKSRSQEMLANARNIVITRKNSPPHRDERSLSPLNTRHKSPRENSKERQKIVITKRNISPASGKRSPSPLNPRHRPSRENSKERQKIVITKRNISPARDKRSPSPLNSRHRSSRENSKEREKINISSRSTAAKVKKVTIADLNKRIAARKLAKRSDVSEKRKPVASRLSAKRNSTELKKPEKPAPRKSSLKQQKVDSKVLRERTSSESSVSDREDKIEVEIEEIDILDIHEYDDLIFDVEHAEDVPVVETPQKSSTKSRKQKVDKKEKKLSISEDEFSVAKSRKPTATRQERLTPQNDLSESESDGEIMRKRSLSNKSQKSDTKSRKRTLETRKSKHSDDSASESDSDGEIFDETPKPIPKYATKKKQSDKGVKNMPKKRTKTAEVRDPESYSGGTRRVLISTKSIQQSRNTNEKEKTRDRGSNRSSPVYETDENLRKPHVKKRLGSRVVIKSQVVSKTDKRETRDTDSDNDSRRSIKPRKIVKMKRKKSSHHEEDFLEAKIQRIKEQNGLILRRQREIQIEKEQFG